MLEVKVPRLNLLADWRFKPESAPALKCIDLLSVIAQRSALEPEDWSQIQKLGEHLVRARRAQGVKEVAS
jgi:hypothetical protein